ncbi:MAG: hypothetical protein ACYS0G_04220 [Planctomycetota bacterium]|jgi:hypothetical protein
MSEPDAHSRPSPPPHAPPRRLLRAVLLAAALTPVLVAVALWIVTRSWFIVLLITPVVERKLGGDVDIGTAEYLGQGTLVLNDLTLRSRSLEGPAAQAVRVGRAEVAVDVRAILDGEVRIRELVLDGVLLRFSEDGRNPGVFNFKTLDPDWSLDRRVDQPAASVRITSAVIEVGLHVDRQYRRIGHRRVAGKMYPAIDGGGWYDFELKELDENNVSLGEAGLFIDGSWNIETLEHSARIYGLVLDDQTVGMCPQMARLWLQRMDPKGHVSSAFVQSEQGQPFKAELVVDRMALTIPISTKEFSASYQQGRVEATASLPRMHVEKGTVRLEGDKLTLEDLVGEFRRTDGERQQLDMPYSVYFSIHDLPKLDWEDQHGWMEQVLAEAPFEMKLQMNDFSLDESAASAAQTVELPRQVADTLAKFNLTGWTLSTKVEMTRPAPVVGDDGQRVAQPIQTVGKAYISDASGAFGAFPYPLEDVDAFVEFDNEQVTLHYLTAKGSDNSRLRMSGTIAPPGNTAALDLTLTARQVPLDDRFRKALRGGQLATFDRMLHKASYEAIREANLLDDAAVDDARQARRERIAALTALREEPGPADNGPARERLEREIGRLDTLIEAGPFELGGHVDLDLTIERPRGADQMTDITGEVSVHRAGVVYERFPYPIYVLGGTLRVETDRILIEPGEHGEGIPIASSGGGRGSVTGEVRLLRDESGNRVEPDLAAELTNDYLSDLLFAAMPLTKREKAAPAEAEATDSPPGAERSVIASLLSGAGLSGWLNHKGTVTANDAGQPTFDFTVELFEGKSEPTDELFQTMREFGLPSPRGLKLDDVEAQLRISPEEIRLEDFSGKRGDARITGEGQVDLQSDPIQTTLTVLFNDLALERYMIDLTPGGGAKRTAALWDRYQPQGTYDAKLHYQSGGDGAARPELILWPKELRLQIDDRPVWLICERGELRLHPHEVSFDDFVLRLRDGNREDGVIVLDGGYGLSEAGKGLSLQGEWTDGQLGSPLITEALWLIGAEHHAQRYRGYDPSGTFDSTFSYESPRGDLPRDYEFIVRPDTIGLRVNDTPVYADLEPESELAFAPGRIILRNVTGTHAGGRFFIDGAVETMSPIDVDLDVGYVGRIDSPQVRAILPAKVRSTLESLEIQAAEPVELRDAWLRVQQAEPGSSPGQWETAFAGRLHTKGASMKVGGADITEVDGVIELLTEYSPGQAPSLDIQARAVHARVLGRQATDLEAQVILVEDGRVVAIPAMRAVVHGGVVTGEALIGLAPGSGYQAEIDVAGVSLAGFATGAPSESGSPSGSGNPPHGETYGSFSVSGRRGTPESRRGRGALRVAWGRMASMPLTLRLLQLFELMPPFSGNLDFADVDFYVNGDRVVFEKLFLECPTLQLLGEGEMSYPGLELDVRFRTRGTVPLVKDLIGGLSDQLFIVEVTGPLADPKARLVPLPGVSQAGSTEPSGPVAHASSE